LRRAYTFFPPEIDDFIAPAIREEYRDWFRRWRREAAAARHPLESLAHMVEWDGWLTMNWEMASACGVRRTHPFWTRELLELAFSCHPAELIGPGTKKLLRA